MKRLFDFALSFFLLVLLSPVMIVLFLMIYYCMGAPVLFRQDRPGLSGIIFRIYKFRTMKDLCDKNGLLLPDAQRMTPLGSFIRKFSLDELPQLFNVFKGEMSFVGPRPLLVEYLPLYNAEQAKRHNVRPGITGWAQVNGRNALSWEEKFKFDIYYVEHQSFWFDLQIMFLTIRKIFHNQDVSAAGHVTAQKFTGTDA